MWIPVLTDIYFYPSLNISRSDTTEIPVKIARSGFQIFSHFSWHNIMQISDSCALLGNKVRDYPTSASCPGRRVFPDKNCCSNFSLTKALLLFLLTDCRNRLNPPKFSSKKEIVLIFHSHLKFLLWVCLFLCFSHTINQISASKSSVFWRSTFCFFFFFHIFL